MAVVAALVLVLGAPAADATLSKALARNAAEITAIGFYSHKTWAQDWKVGACRQASAERVDCDARVEGDHLIACAAEPTVRCDYVFHVCRFTVAVHEAGFERIGRVQGVKCRTRPHSG